MFLVGGPPFSGTTLLAFLLNQGNLICLDEPDFHNPRQSHRGIPFLKRSFPDKVFPDDPSRSLTVEESIRLTEKCERSLSPKNLGVKTCNALFIEHAKIYRQAQYPVIAIVRDIRDALVTPLPEWLTEPKVNRQYRMIWDHRELFDVWIRYEDLITRTQSAMNELSRILSCTLQVPEEWDSKTVPGPMLKLPRHHLLKSGRISKDRTGIWKSSGKIFSDETHQTAQMMGYQ